MAIGGGVFDLRGVPFTSVAGLVLACGSSEPAGAADEPASDAAATELSAEEYLEQSAPLFEIDRLLDVQVEMDPDEWAALGAEGRDMSAALCGSTFDSLSDPYSYYGSDVLIDGERVSEVGVRKKGFLGSLSMTRPSLKVKFDEFVPAAEFSGMERLTLNNNRQDPSMIRQCVTYWLFSRAGVPAPRCSFATVTVNGDHLGTYSHVEAPSRRFLRVHFSDDSGNLYEGQGADFDDRRVDLFQLKTNETINDRSRLVEMKEALKAGDADLLQALEPYVDVDTFLTFWAMESITGHWDTYSTTQNNFHVYDEPGTGFHFMPWGTDATLSEDALVRGDPRPQSISASSVLSSRLFALSETRDRYIARVRELLDTIWDEAEIIAYIDGIAELLPDEDAAGVESIREFVRRRREVVTAELDAGPAPLPNTEFCFEPGDPTTGTFETSWTDGADTAISAPGASVTLDLTIDGSPVSLANASAVAGVFALGSITPGVRIAGTRDDGKLLLIQLSVEERLYGDSAVPFHAFSNAGFIIAVDLATTAQELIGFIADGSMTFDAAGRNAGDPVSGSFTGRFYRALR